MIILVVIELNEDALKGFRSVAVKDIKRSAVFNVAMRVE